MDAHSGQLTVEPVTPERWGDLEKLAGERGFIAGCWCMWWRESGQGWTARHDEGNRVELKAIVDQREEPGMLAYLHDEPIGWVAVAPRIEYPRLDRSAKLKPVDDKPVWSITCFYIDRRHRRQGVARALLDAAIEYARAAGAETIEAYPIDTSVRPTATSGEIFTGNLSMFLAAGFEEVMRRGGRPIVRLG